MNKQDLTDEELLQAAKKAKSTKLMNAFLIGFLIGVACVGLIAGLYTAVKSGPSVPSIVPIVFSLFILLMVRKKIRKNKKS